jgi:hypothetical protein
MTSVQNLTDLLTIVVKLSGVISDAELTTFVRDYRVATDSYAGRSHLVLADLRGLKALSPTQAQTLGAAIAYARSRGVFRCAHLNDDSVAKLQAARLAREVDPENRATIHVVSLTEAEAILADARQLISPSMRRAPKAPGVRDRG